MNAKDAQLPPAQKTVDGFVDRSGGKVYSTGTEDIRLRILPNDHSSMAPRDKKQWIKGYTPFQSGIYLVSPGSERFIGYNIPGGQTVNLGRIPPAELVFAIKTFDGYTFQTGGGERNPDKLDHAFTRTFLSGVIEVWFEDAPGPIHTGRSDRDFDDICLQLSGGITGNAAVPDLVKMIKEQKGQAREAAIAALKKIDPKAVAEASSP